MRLSQLETAHEERARFAFLKQLSFVRELDTLSNISHGYAKLHHRNSLIVRFSCSVKLLELTDAIGQALERNARQRGQFTEEHFEELAVNPMMADLYLREI